MATPWTPTIPPKDTDDAWAASWIELPDECPLCGAECVYGVFEHMQYSQCETLLTNID